MFLETIFEKGYILNRLDWMSEIAISWNKIGFSLYRVGEAVAMLSLCLCASVVLLEMPAIIILAVTDFNHRGTEQGIGWNRIIALSNTKIAGSHKMYDVCASSRA